MARTGIARVHLGVVVVVVVVAAIAVFLLPAATAHSAGTSEATDARSNAFVPTETTVEPGPATARSVNHRALGTRPTMLLLVLTALAALSLTLLFFSRRRARINQTPG